MMIFFIALAKAFVLNKNAKACNYFCNCLHCKNNENYINLRTFKLLKLALKNNKQMNNFKNLIQEEIFFVEDVANWMD